MAVALFRQIGSLAMGDRPRRAESIRDIIRQILLREWDPIGIAENANLSGEYDDYIGPIHGLLFDHRSRDYLVDLLWEVETSVMGLPGDRRRIESVAESLITTWAASTGGHVTQDETHPKKSSEMMGESFDVLE